MISGAKVTYAGDEAVLQRFRVEYRPSVKKLENFYRHVQMKVVYRFTRLEGKPTRIYEQDLATNGDLVRYVRRAENGPADETSGATRVVVANPHASFLLTKARDESKFRVERLVDLSTATGATALAARALFAPFTVTNEWIPEMLEEKGFEVTGAKQIERAGMTMIRIDWQRPAFGSETLKQTGWFVFDPAKNWALHEYGSPFRVIDGKYAVMHGTVLYEGSASGIPLVKSVRWYLQEHRVGDGQAVGRQWGIHEYEVKQLTPVAPPAEKFKMSAFGLPNPGAVADTGAISRMIWGLSVLAVAAAGFFWWLGHRKKRMSSGH